MLVKRPTDNTSYRKGRLDLGFFNGFVLHLNVKSYSTLQMGWLNHRTLKHEVIVITDIVESTVVLKRTPLVLQVIELLRYYRFYRGVTVVFLYTTVGI